MQMTNKKSIYPNLNRNAFTKIVMHDRNLNILFHSEEIIVGKTTTDNNFNFDKFSLK